MAVAERSARDARASVPRPRRGRSRPHSFVAFLLIPASIIAVGLAGSPREAAAQERPPPGAPDVPTGAPPPPDAAGPALVGDEALRERIRRSSELRIRDFGRAVLLGLDRAERLREAAARAAERVAAEPPGDAAGSDLARSFRLWSDPVWVETAAELLDDAERATFEERARKRIGECERAAAQLAVAELAELLQLDPGARLDLVGLAAKVPGGAWEESSSARYARAETWARGSLGDIGSAQLHRLLQGYAPEGSGDGAETLRREGDLEVWVEAAAVRGKLSEEERVLLFDCGRRAILVARVDPESPADPLDDPLLAKALATIAGVDLAKQLALERDQREAALRASRARWLIAELDLFLWLSEIQSGALRLVLEEGQDLTRLDPRAPLGETVGGLSKGTRRSIEALLDAAQLRALEPLRAPLEGP